ncbi:MAG: FtsW/RodA/SpoVE family cell cycle protein [Clostridia bacterium]|nr:FtsW/RodA/SpoVE family cell cycle protein [Clostridia bacterium]
MTKMRFRPMLYITLVNIIGFLMLFIYSGASDFTYMYSCLILCCINTLMYLLLYQLDWGDLYLFLTVSMLVSIGLIMLSRIDIALKISGADGDYASRQILWFMIGIAAYFVTVFIFGKISFWHRLKYFYMLATFGLIFATVIFGKEINGSKNWIVIGSFSIQPSEIVKIVYCFCIGTFFSEMPAFDSKKKDVRPRILTIPIDEIILCIYVYATMGCLALFQKEWGTALLLFMIYFTMCFVYKSSNLLKLINICGIVLVGLVGFFLLADHIGVRVSAWQDPWKDASGGGYQIVQSLIAIASGGYFGTGLGNGMPNIVPFSQTDFIFSAICEEMGMFTGFAVILLYFLLTYRGIKITVKATNEYLKAVCLSLVISVGYQTFIIIGGCIKLIPLTGITLPFVSYGGSSMIVSFVMIGIITAVSFYGRKKKKA